MTAPLKLKDSKVDEELRGFIEKTKTNIKIVGCGGAGNNTITRLMQAGITGAETIALNTDAQHLLYTNAHTKILIGKKLTRGLGAGKNPDIGLEAAKESKEEIKNVLQGADMIFITCGEGGGTGTGSAPVVAEIARAIGALTIAIVTLPFTMEGKKIRENAERGLKSLKEVTDTIIIIPNDRLLQIVPNMDLPTAFKFCDEILVNAVKGITELVTRPGLVNVDFADIKAIMSNGGMAMIGMGESNSENRAVESIEMAINNPLLTTKIDGAKGALVNIVGGQTLTISETHKIMEVVCKHLSPEAKIIWGAKIAKELGDTVRTLLIVTGIEQSNALAQDKFFGRQKKKDIEKILKVDFVE